MFRKVSSGLAKVVLCGLIASCGRAPTKAPAPAAAPAIALDAALANRFVKAGASQSMTAQIKLSAKRRSSTARPPVNLALLVDTSGSMEGRAIEDARAASLALLGSLAPEDRISVVVFHSKAEVLLPSSRVEDADMKDLRAKISAMKAQGTTDMAEGLHLAIDEVAHNLDREGVNRVVLVGDGVPNDDGPVLPLVAQASARGISITTLGLGTDIDETLMGRIAQESGGKFHFVDDSNKVASFFAEEIVRLHKVVARGAVLEIRPGPGVSVQRCIGRPGSPIGHGLAVSLGDVTLGDELEIVCELAENAAKDGANVEVLDAVLRYTEGVGGAPREERVFVGAKATKDDAKIKEGRQESVEQAAARAKDAAATLDRIQQQRAADRARERPPPPKSSAGAGAAFDGPARAPAPSPVAPAPAEQREQLRMHDEAMHTLGF
jgi:Ca-activated chloride channel family protein